MSNYQTVRRMILGGAITEEIIRDVPQLNATSIRRYVGKANRSFTDAERATVKKAREERPTEPDMGYRRAFSRRTPLSPIHTRIGRQLAFFRVSQEQTVSEFSREHNFSNRITLSAMEQGFYDFKISEVSHISSILGVSIEALLAASTEEAIAA